MLNLYICAVLTSILCFIAEYSVKKCNQINNYGNLGPFLE